MVMLSSLTRGGAETSLKAFALGAVECFSKPLKATPEQFTKTVGKLGKIVLAAANSNLHTTKAPREHTAEAASFTWNGRIAVFSAAMGGIDAVTGPLSHFPAAARSFVPVPRQPRSLLHQYDRDPAIARVLRVVLDQRFLVGHAFDAVKASLGDTGAQHRLPCRFGTAGRKRPVVRTA